MNRIKLRTTLITTYLALLVEMFVCGFPMLALAQQPVPPVTNQPQAKPYVPPIERRSGRKRPASPRGPCSASKKQSEKELVALIPETNLGLTVTQYPTFFFYIPETSAKTVEFVLTDEKDNEVYTTTFAIAGNSGIISIKLPASETLTKLKIGTPYRWYFSVICDSEDRSGDAYIDGWVQRVEPNPALIRELKLAAIGSNVSAAVPSTRQQEVAILMQRLAVYEKANIWYERLATLAELRRLSPNDSKLAAKWAKLLSSIGLEEIATEPFIQPYSTSALETK